MSTQIRRLIVPFAVLVAAFMALAPSAAVAGHSKTVELNGVRTTLATDPATTKVLLQNGILPLPVRPAGVDATWSPAGPSLLYSFPITGGRVNASSLAGYINHSGGLKFVNLANGKSLTLTDFRIEINAAPGLTAAVNGDPKVRVRILDLDLSKATVAKHPPRVTVTGVKATLTSTAAGALNSSLGVKLFAAGLTLGTADVKARID